MQVPDCMLNFRSVPAYFIFYLFASPDSDDGIFLSCECESKTTDHCLLRFLASIKLQLECPFLVFHFSTISIK